MSRFQKGAPPKTAPGKPAPGKAAPPKGGKTEEKGEAPIFEVMLPEKQEVVELSGVDFRVTIKGTQPIDVTWCFDGEPIDIENNTKVEYEVDEDTGEYKLIISEADLDSDSGIYRCTAKNAHGECYCECDLLLEEMPEHVKQALQQYNKT